MAASKAKWLWTNEMVKHLIDCVKEYKSTCEFNSIDFNSDKVKLYDEVRKAMALLYEESDFGPKEVSAPQKPVKEMNDDEYKVYKSVADKEKQIIKNGYKRIKEKLKSIRQDYSKAVISGTRSGSGKIVSQHFDELASIWGGSPATEPLSFGIDSSEILTASLPDEANDQEENDCSLDSSLDSSRASTPFQPTKDDFENGGGNESECSEAGPSVETNKKRKRKIGAVSDIPKLIDCKRKQLEKRLTSAQRDQKLLEAAKEDTLMRKEMMDCFKETSKSTAQAIVNVGYYERTGTRYYSGHSPASTCSDQATTADVSLSVSTIL